MTIKTNLFFLLDSVDTGGVENHTMSLVKELQKEFTISFVLKNFTDKNIPGVSEKIFLQQSRLKRIISIMKIMFKLDGSSILISQMKHNNTLISILATLLCKTRRIILVEHTDFISSINHEPKLTRFLMACAARFLYHRFAVVFVSREAKNRFIQRFSRSSPYFLEIHNCIEYCTSIQNPRFLVPQRLLFVGRFTKAKNIGLLIKAFELIANEFPNLELHLVGDGELYEELHKTVKASHFADRIKFMGYKREPFAEYYNTDTLFVLPSLWEGFGNVIIEAMSFNLPVAVSNCASGPSEIVDYGNYGRLFESNDEINLRDTLSDILKNGIWTSPQRTLDYAKQESVEKYKNLINSMLE